MKHLIFKLLLCSLVFSSCHEDDPILERALILAKNNRSELERVLVFYEKDSIRLEATKFLIKNMPGHYSYKADEIDMYYDAVDSVLRVKCSTEAMLDTMEKVSLRYNRRYSTISDVEVVTAKYIIENIEEAFSQWKKGSWCTHISFQDFCEYVLPYKVVELQPLDEWRSYLKRRYNAGLEELKYCDTYKNSAIWATHCVNGKLRDSLKPDIRASKIYPIHRINTKLRVPFGVCGDYVEIAAAVLRSKGIPVAIDFTPQWPFRSSGHSWNVVLANNGKMIPFSGVESNPGEPHKLDEKMAKIYRKTYAINPEMEELLKTEQCIPGDLGSLFIKDVTSEYMITSDVAINVEDLADKYAYLAVFDDRTWKPVAFGKVDNHKATFKDVGRNILYLPVCYKNNTVIPVGKPFVLTSKGDINDITPQKSNTQSITLYRKYPLFPHVQSIADRIVGGKFQVANTTSFKDSVTLYEVKDWGTNGVEIQLPSLEKKYRYWRYYQSRNDAYCNIAEMAFVERTSHQIIKGNIIGTEGSRCDNSDFDKEAAFDGDLLLFFDAPIASGGWVGMDFGRPVDIEKIIYTPRNDGNSICIGDSYELFYWNDKNWTSLERQVATTVKLRYKNVPTGALYLLRNLTQGIEERIFIYKNEKQEFW